MKIKKIRFAYTVNISKKELTYINDDEGIFEVKVIHTTFLPLIQITDRRSGEKRFTTFFNVSSFEPDLESLEKYVRGK